MIVYKTSREGGQTMKENYENLEMEVISFDTEDIIATSGENNEGELD